MLMDLKRSSFFIMDSRSAVQFKNNLHASASGHPGLRITERRAMIADGLIGPELMKWKASVFQRLVKIKNRASGGSTPPPKTASTWDGRDDSRGHLD